MIIRDCPYCGSEVKAVTGYRRYWVQCSKPSCEATGPLKHTKGEAVARWNRVAG